MYFFVILCTHPVAINLTFIQWNMSSRDGRHSRLGSLKREPTHLPSVFWLESDKQSILEAYAEGERAMRQKELEFLNHYMGIMNTCFELFHAWAIFNLGLVCYNS